MSLRQRLERLRRRRVERRRILRIPSGDRIEHDRHVRDVPRHRPDVIERVGHRQDAEATDAAVGGFQSDDAVGGRRVANRPSRVRADGRVTQPCRGRDARSARRHAGPSIRIPGIEGHVARRVVARRRALRQIQLARAAPHRHLAASTPPWRRHPGRSPRAPSCRPSCGHPSCSTGLSPQSAPRAAARDTCPPRCPARLREPSPAPPPASRWRSS